VSHRLVQRKKILVICGWQQRMYWGCSGLRLLSQSVTVVLRSDDKLDLLIWDKIGMATLMIDRGLNTYRAILAALV
jgi:hypothetical protein